MTEPLMRLFGADIQPFFEAGSVLHVGRPSMVRAHARLNAGVGSAVGGYVLRIEGTDDPTDPDGWEDVLSTRNDTGVVAVEHTFPVPAQAKLAYALAVDARGFAALRLLARATGGPGQNGDKVVADAVTW